MSNLKKDITNMKEIREIYLIIDSFDVMVKEFVAGHWNGEELFSGFTYSFTLPIIGIRAFQKGKIPIEAKLSADHQKIEVKFTHPFQKGETYAYELHLLVNPHKLIQKLGSLNIIDWPKQDLTKIIFLPSAGKIFFSSVFAQIKVDPATKYKIITPGPFSRSLISHSRKSSAIRIEWGQIRPINLKFSYIIRNKGRNPATNFKLGVYYPPNTKFQEVKIDSEEKFKILKDEDENEIFEYGKDKILPKDKFSLSFEVSILKKGNASVILPYFGKWEEYRNITTPNTTGEKMIQSSQFWPLSSKNIQKLVNILKKNSKNVSEFIKLAFEFVNQKIHYEINGKRDDAETVLQTRKGDCSEFSDLFVTILRGGGIPAKIVHGLVVDLPSFKLEPHAWCEFFSTQAGGWRECDPTWGFLTGVSCQHLTRRREGLVQEQHAYFWSYQGETEISVDEQISIIKI